MEERGTVDVIERPILPLNLLERKSPAKIDTTFYRDHPGPIYHIAHQKFGGSCL